MKSSEESRRELTMAIQKQASTVKKCLDESIVWVNPYDMLKVKELKDTCSQMQNLATMLNDYIRANNNLNHDFDYDSWAYR